MNGWIDDINAQYTTSFGSRVWEILHPGQVQAEYDALGQSVPSKASIVVGSGYDAFFAIPDALSAGVDVVEHSAAAVADAAPDIAKYALLGLAVILVLKFK